MDPRLLPVLVAGLVLAPFAAVAQLKPSETPPEGLKPTAEAQEGLKWTWTGSIGVGGIITNENSNNPWKLFEYRDLDSGVLSNVLIRGRGERDYIDLFAENIGRHDAFFDVRGGRYNVFKYQLYGDWLQHNLSFGPDGARSPYAGIGSSTLTTVFPQLNSNVPPWNSFDFETKRRVLGGFFELSNIYVSPWYARLDANELRMKGTYPDSGSNGTSPGNGFTDLPSPIDQVTRNFSAEAGYSTRQGQFAVNFLNSKFSNDDTLLRWTNPFFGGNQYDTTVLAPDSNLWKISANGALRALPWNSTLAGRVTYGELTNSVNILGSMLNTGPTFPATNPSDNSFKGKIKNTTVTASFTSNPTRAVDTRLYYNYYDKKNDSNQITFLSPALGCPAPGCTTELFGYTKNNAGLDVGYRFTPQNRLSGGIDYVHIDRDRADYPKTTQWTFGAQWRNSSLDWLGVLLGAAYIQRRSDFALGNAGANANDPLFLERYVTKYDASNVDQTRVRLVLDSSPVPLLDLGFEAYWKWNDYKSNNSFDPLLGRTKDTRQEYYASISYGDPQAFRVTFFGDIEYIQYDSEHRNINGGTCPAGSPNCFNPNTSPTANAYNWKAKNWDQNWALGLGTDWQALARLLLKGSVIWSRTHGWVDITSQNNFGNPLPINNYDTTSKLALNLKGIYTFDRHWQFTFGYAYEQYHYSDDQYNGYMYTIPSGTPPNFTSTSYLSGAYAFPDYSANIFYFVANYKF
jgi:hypothetical protein